MPYLSCVVQNTKDDQFSFIQPTKNRIEGFQLHIFLLLKSTITIHTSLLKKKRKEHQRTYKHPHHHQFDERFDHPARWQIKGFIGTQPLCG